MVGSGRHFSFFPCQEGNIQGIGILLFLFFLSWEVDVIIYLLTGNLFHINKIQGFTHLG